MFTGIIEAVSPILTSQADAQKLKYKISRPAHFTDIKEGSSIACNGICLTVIAFDQASFWVEVMHETAQKTNALQWNPSDRLNLERALRVGDRLDGHWVQGHVDTCLDLIKKFYKGNTQYLRFAYPQQVSKYLIAQGSIAVNGASLTIAELSSTFFSVALISHTENHTNLKDLPNMAKVNIEFDVVGKYLDRFNAQNKHELDLGWIREQGF